MDHSPVRVNSTKLGATDKSSDNSSSSNNNNDDNVLDENEKEERQRLESMFPPPFQTMMPMTKRQRQQQQPQHPQSQSSSSFFPSTIVASLRSKPWRRLRLPSTALFFSKEVHEEEREEEENESVVTTTTTTSTTTSTNSESTNDPKESVHLKLYETTSSDQPPQDENEDEDETKQQRAKRKRKPYTLLTYRHVNNNNNNNKNINGKDDDKDAVVVYTGLNISKRRFRAWLQYLLGDAAAVAAPIDTANIESVQQERVEGKERQQLREQWKAGRLICDRTELLTVYDSEKRRNSNHTSTNNNNWNQAKNNNNSHNNHGDKKRGGFPDLLHLYASRYMGILKDEGDSDVDLVEWLEGEYGQDTTTKLRLITSDDKPVEEQFETLQHFLDWFRSKFPYFYDRCDHCGASFREEPKPEAQTDVEAASAAANNDNIESVAKDKETDKGKEHDGENDSDDDDDDGGTFLGYIYPNEEEAEGKAGRTELYQCHRCHKYTRFPRFNAAKPVLASQRGRCGEYSMLLYRMLRALGHETRWVVDWADHVWAEIYLNQTWIHLDPCEAAVNQPLLYEGWGKQQTYIVGFHAPLHNTTTTGTPLIQDVTHHYTSDNSTVIQERRDETDQVIQESVDRTSKELEQKLQGLFKS